MHGMPHARLLWWNALLWGHYAAHSCHWRSSCVGLTRPGYKTLVTRQLGFHLLLLAVTTHKANIKTKETVVCPLQYKDKCSQKWSRIGYQWWRALISDWGYSSSESSFNITTKQNNTKSKNIQSNAPSVRCIFCKYLISWWKILHQFFNH